MAMRRLIAWLRQSQSYCSDAECVDELSLPQSTPASSFLVMSLLVAFALAMFMMRPSSLRSAPQDSKPPRSQGVRIVPTSPSPNATC